MSNKPDSEADLFLTLEPLCDAFESAWQTDSPPRLEEYLEKVGADLQERLLWELSAIEIERRLNRGEEPTLVEFLQRFPDHQECLVNLANQHPEWNLKGTIAVASETVTAVSSQEDTNSHHAVESTRTSPDATGSPTPQKIPLRRFGDYDLLEEIGQGGMGVVYKARQRKLNRIVAVKMIRAGQLASSSDIRRFQSEAKAIGQLEHPQIVPIYEVDEEDGHHFFSMAFVDGEDLSSKLRDGPLPPRQAAQLVQEIALAIHHAHQQGIIHRDLKPANILLTPEGQIRVTDFGLAKHQEASHGPTVTGDIVGTPGYMSPEQAAGQHEAVGTSSDIYSLGAILYSLLTGRPPFQAATVFETLLQVLEDSPVSPRHLNPAVDRDLETICLKCLEKTDVRRYQTAEELSHELKRFLDGHPIQARPVGTLTRVWRWCCRRPKLAAAWAIVAGLLLLLGIAGPLAAIRQTHLKTLADQSSRKSRQSATKYRAERQRANTEATTAIKQRERADQQAQLARSQKDLIAEQATVAKRALYLARMNIAYSAWKNADMRSMRQLLGSYQTAGDGNDYRGFEWYYLNELAQEESHVIEAHPKSVQDIAIRPGSKETATLGGDGFLRIWNTQTGKLIRELKPMSSYGRYTFRDGRSAAAIAGGRSLDYSVDGRWLAVGCRYGEIQFFDPDTLQLVKKSRAGTVDLMQIALSPDASRCIVSNGQGAILSVQVETGKVSSILKERRERERRLSDRYSPGGLRWDPKPFACSRNGKLLAFVDTNRDVVIWNLENGREANRIKRSQFRELRDVSPTASVFAFGSDGKWLMHGDPRGEISAWRPLHDYLLFRQHDHYRYIYELAVTPDDRFVVSAGHDHTIRMTGLNDVRQPVVLRGHEAAVTAIAIAPNGKFVVGGDVLGYVRVFSLVNSGNPRLLVCPDGEYSGIAFHPAQPGFALAQSDATIGIWDDASREPLRKLSGHQGAVVSVTYRPDGEELASGGADGTIRFWNPDTGEFLRQWKAHQFRVKQIAYSPDGSRLASISSDKQLKIWNINDGTLIQSIPFDNAIVRRLSWNADGTRVAVGDQRGLARVFDVVTGKPVFEFPGRSGIYSPDGRRFIYVMLQKRLNYNQDWKTILVCDASTGKKISEMHGHRDPIVDFIVTPDNQRVISLDSGGMIKVWDMETTQELLSINAMLVQEGGLTTSIGGTLVMDPQGRKLALVHGGHVRLWSTGRISNP